MKVSVKCLLTLIAGELFVALSAQAKPAVEEIADPTLPDIAAVHYVAGQGPVILFNPILCKQAGRALCEFYRYHEYGHIALRHHERNTIGIKEKEREADRWAARHAPRPVVLAAWHYFSSGGGATPMHGDGPTRAARLIEGSKPDTRTAAAGELPRPVPHAVALSALAL